MPKIPGMQGDVYFGGNETVDWRNEPHNDSEEPTKEEMQSLIAVLGFDPRTHRFAKGDPEEDEDDEPEKYAATNDDGRWVTIGADEVEGGGTPVFLGPGGEIKKGPARLVGHDVDKIPPAKELDKPRKRGDEQKTPTVKKKPPIARITDAVRGHLSGIDPSRVNELAARITRGVTDEALERELHQHHKLSKEDAKEATEKIRESINHELESLGIDPKDIYPQSKDTDEKHWQKLLEIEKEERSKRIRDAIEWSAGKDAKKEPLHTLDRYQVIALRKREKLAQLERDWKVIKPVYEARLRVREAIDGSDYGTIRRAEEDFDAAYSARGVAAALKRNRFPWNDDKKAKASPLEAAEVLSAGIQQLKRDFEESTLSTYDDLGVKAVEDHQKAIAEAFERGESISEEVVKPYLYDSWVPQELKETIRTKEFIREANEGLTSKRQKALEKLLAASMESASATVKRIMKQTEKPPSQWESIDAEIDSAMSEIERSNKGYMDFLQSVNPSEVSDELKQQIERRRLEHEEKTKPLWEKVKQGNEKRRQAGREWVASFAPENRVKSVDWKDDNTSGTSTIESGKAKGFLTSILSDKWSDLPVSVSRINPKEYGQGRAYCSGMTLHLDENTNAATIIHEYGHAMEHHNSLALARLSHAFVNQQIRESGDKYEQLGRGYGNLEIAAKDGFLDAYTGKQYSESTEIVSMGLQHLYEDPWKFRQESPEHFAYMMAVIHGELT